MEVCVELLNDIEMENKTSKQVETKRDHKWLSNNIEIEPCSKKQSIEALENIETVPCAKADSKEALFNFK